ncbi:uncharacterized protein JCM6883_000804 [Sporobolomyces salmoneus]|uniref:uncharacterized protein n=1 Tax=Sporobolomyces salmoneus TaxID=183962 RepID=UPI003172796F
MSSSMGPPLVPFQRLLNALPTGSNDAERAELDGIHKKLENVDEDWGMMNEEEPHISNALRSALAKARGERDIHAYEKLKSVAEQFIAARDEIYLHQRWSEFCTGVAQDLESAPNPDGDKYFKCLKRTLLGLLNMDQYEELENSTFSTTGRRRVSKVEALEQCLARLKAARVRNDDDKIVSPLSTLSRQSLPITQELPEQR